MALIYVSSETQRRFAAAAEALGREVDEVPELSLVLLEWFIEQRREGYELLLGLRDDPDDLESMRVQLVPPLRVVQMDEGGVETLGVLDVVEPGSPTPAIPDADPGKDLGL